MSFGGGFNGGFNGGGFGNANHMNNNNNNNNLAARINPRGGPGNQNQQQDLVDIEIRNWESGGKDDLVSFLHRKTRILLQNVWTSGPVLHGQVRAQDARPFVKFSGTKFAGQTLRINIVSENSGNGGGSARSGTIRILADFLHQRYNPQAKILDLQAYKADQYLIQNKLFESSSTTSKMFPALMKVAEEEKLNVETVNLANNGLQDVSSVSALANAFPGLKNLSLANNAIAKIRGLDSWRMKFPKLRELLMTGNPIVNEPSYKSDIMKMFPRLILLDGEVIRDESQIDRVALPMPVVHTFFDTDDTRAVATEFLPSYFNFFDSDRTQLLALYDNESTFSMSLCSNAPRNPSSTSQGGNWSAYIPISRNLERVASSHARNTRLCTGTQPIARMFSKIPPTDHSEMLQNPAKMAVEAWITQGVRTAADVGIVICVHGEYAERGNHVLRSFDRTFILVPGTTQKYLIATEMFTVRGYGGYNAWFVDRSAVPGGGPAPVPGSVPPVQPAVTPATPAAPVTGMTPELQGLTPANLLVVRELMQQTGLNTQFARMCAEQANYDLNQALFLFQQSKAQLPPNAFT